MHTIKKLLGYIILYFKIIYVLLRTLLNGKKCDTLCHEKNNEVLILGNGPSLKDIDLMQIKPEVEIACVNSFAIYNELFSVVKPEYYVLMDSIYFMDLDKIDQKNREERETLFGILNSVDWDIRLIIPQGCSTHLNNPHIMEECICSSRLFSDDYNKLVFNLYSKNLAVCGLQNVLIGALHYFIMKKVPNIYLAGADMNEFKLYRIDERNHVLADYEHFYGIDSVDCTENGVIPQGEFSKWLGYYAKMLKEFYLIRGFADYQNVRIINLSERSFIDVFDKVSWKELVNGK